VRGSDATGCARGANVAQFGHYLFPDCATFEFETADRAFTGGNGGNGAATGGVGFDKRDCPQHLPLNSGLVAEKNERVRKKGSLTRGSHRIMGYKIIGPAKTLRPSRLCGRTAGIRPWSVLHRRGGMTMSDPEVCTESWVTKSLVLQKLCVLPVSAVEPLGSDPGLCCTAEAG
jgi:hypothetical protein